MVNTTVTSHGTADFDSSLLLCLQVRWYVTWKSHKKDMPVQRMMHVYTHRTCLPVTCYRCDNEKCCTCVTVHKKTRYKSKIAILDNAHIKMQTLCYFMLKSDWPSGDKITSVWENAILFSAFCSFSLYLSLLLKPDFLKKLKYTWFSHSLSRTRPTHLTSTC